MNRLWMLAMLVGTVPLRAEAAEAEEVLSSAYQNISSKIENGARSAWCSRERAEAGSNIAATDALHAAGEIKAGERDILKRMHENALRIVNRTCETLESGLPQDRP